jgi:outer membrane protein assembly factor BamB
LGGTWSRFRGDGLDAIASQAANVSRQWSEVGPPKLWQLELGEGYAGAAIWRGRAFVMDYDREKKEEALRCLSLDDGREIWRYSYPHSLKRDHGVTRIVPAVTSNSVIAMGPKCHVLCVEINTGNLRWSIDMVRDYGATVPPWYTGQCPLVDGERVILAPTGTNSLVLAVDILSGKVLWRTPNPRGWKMTHSSVMPVEFAGKRMFVYCASGGVVGVSAEDGAILWDTTDWKISIATVPCPLDLGQGRIFLTGGYSAGSMLLQLKEVGERITPEVALRLKAEVFGATQHAPIFHDGHLFGVRADGRFVCLGLDGKVVWTSEPGSNFGLGSFIMVNDVIFALNDGGTLHLIEATPSAYRPLTKARVLEGPESWAPMAFADGRLIARDLHRMVCLDVAGRGPTTLSAR